MRSVSQPYMPDDSIPLGSLIGRLTADAQARRGEFAHGTVVVDGKVYRMREDWAAVMQRHAKKYGVKADDRR